METYQRVDRRRAERYARRMERKAREERRERMLAPIKLAIQVIIGAAILYFYLFFGSLWASM